MGFPGGAVVKKICLSIQEEAIDKDLITQSLGWKDPLEEEWHPNLGFLTGESQERGVWQATVHSISKTWTQLSDSTNTRKSSIQQQTKKKERKKENPLFKTKTLSSVQSLNFAQLFATPWAGACQASLSFTISWRWLKLMSIKLVMPSNHLILCHPLLLLPSIFPSIRVFSKETVLHIR